MRHPKILQDLIDDFCILPAVGEKTSQRMVMHLLEHNRAGARELAKNIILVLDNIKHCKICRNYSESDLCSICADDKRQKNQLCVVETPTDAIAIENSTSYKGRYFVMMGHLSPIDGIGPDDLGLDKLKNILLTNDIDELILATNATIEGEATSVFIQNMTKKIKNIKMTQLAQGMPTGGELEYINANTINQAFIQRKQII
jgi:recombination protein RecR